MKNWIKPILPGIVGVFLLAGCGTAEQSNKNVDGSGSNDTTASTEQSKENSTTTADQTSTDQKRELEKTLSYMNDGKNKEEKATLTQSDNQDFSLYVLPEFELTAEEPHKDSLYLKENDQIFMRIEMLPNDADQNTIVENTKSQLGAVNSDVKKLDPPADQDWLKDATILQAQNDTDVVTSYLINQDEATVKLTIFNKKDQNYEDALLKMAETIMPTASK
ncbi:hypothetical protein [Falsibacillus albus]|uniref:Lipoprotein n=1 Tax=Falsibacillus albus TaxID=2478915 RepID=A0A3L7K380_9BACI|nr:hypothetical protein [Falsibacillus albus]RLQ97095.1 hypothetical protein D9X91_02755 [Falsibacillus albus]